MSASDLLSDLIALQETLNVLSTEDFRTEVAKMPETDRNEFRTALLKLYDTLKAAAWKSAPEPEPEDDDEEEDLWHELYGPPARFRLNLSPDATKPGSVTTTHLGDFYRTGGGGPECGYWQSTGIYRMVHLISRTWGEEWKVVESYPRDRLILKTNDQGCGNTTTYVALASKLGVK